MKNENAEAKKERVRKPYRVVRVHHNDDDYPDYPHGVDRRMIMEIYPNGTIALREHGRRVRRYISVGNIYVRCIMRDIAKLPRRKRK